MAWLRSLEVFEAGPLRRTDGWIDNCRRCGTRVAIRSAACAVITLKLTAGGWAGERLGAGSGN